MIVKEAGQTRDLAAGCSQGDKAAGVEVEISLTRQTIKAIGNQRLLVLAFHIR